MQKIGKIEKNIPIPEELIHSRYPFRTMEKKESVSITVCEKDCHAYHRIYFARKRVENTTGKRFLARKVSPTEYRVWRVK